MVSHRLCTIAEFMVIYFVASVFGYIPAIIMVLFGMLSVADFAMHS